MTRLYELTVIYDPDAIEADEGSKPTHEVGSLLKKIKADVLETEDWGRKNMTFAIKGKDAGYYQWHRLSLDSKRVEEVESRIKHIDGVLRWLLVLSEDGESDATTNES